MNQPNRRENSFRKAADDYASEGFSVLPCGRDKRPLLPTWAEFQRRPPTVAELDEWTKADPDANVALVCGRLSDLTVVDCDTAEAIATVEALIPDTCNVPVTTTPRGGRHYHFRFTPGLVSRTTAKNIDVKTEGGYVVDAGRTDKGAYTRNGTPLADRPAMPGALLAFLGEYQAAPGPTTDRLPLLTLGTRDEDMFHLAWSFVKDGRSPEEVERICLAAGAAATPPFPECETRAKIKSAWERMRRNDAAVPPTTPERMKMEQFADVLRRCCGGEEESWLVEGWLPTAGCGLLVGSPKNFKTWLSLDLALAVAMSRPFLGQYPVTGGGPVILVQQEDAFKTLAARVAKMLGSAPPTEEGEGASRTYQLDCRSHIKPDGMPFYWITSRDFRFHDATSLKLLEQRIAAVRPRLVIIDPLYVAAGGRSEDFFARTASEMNELKRLRDLYGSGFLVIHHTTWAGRASEDIASMWGSIYLYAWLEYGWSMIETGAKDKGEVRIKRYFKESEAPGIIKATFTIDNWGYAVAIGADDASIDKKIEGAILEGGHFKTEKAIAEATGCTPGGAHKAIKRMGIKKDDDGVFRIPLK